MFAIELAVVAADGAFAAEFAAVDAANRGWNECPFANYSLNCLFETSSPLIDFLASCKKNPLLK